MNIRVEIANLSTKLSHQWAHVKEEWLAIQPQKTEEELDQEELAQAIREAKYEIDVAFANFDCAYNQDLVDFYTYQLKAAQTHYNHLTKLAKEKNLLVS